MRSRYAAFALGKGDYLVDTLAEDHEDRRLPRAELARELGRAKEKQRFVGLAILSAEGDRVLFHARVFERGVDRSFAELSTFVQENGHWRYASGICIQREDLPENVSELTPDTLAAIAGTHAERFPES